MIRFMDLGLGIRVWSLGMFRVFRVSGVCSGSIAV